MSRGKAVEAAIPDPEVVVQAKRRRFTAKYKLCTSWKRLTDVTELESLAPYCVEKGCTRCI